MSRDADLARVADRPNTERARALIDEEIARVEDAQRKQVFKAIREESLDPQAALQAWLRLECLDSVRASLVRRERQARSSGERVKDVM